MVKKLQALLITVIFLIALAIAIPTISISFRGTEYKISNINPADFGIDLLTNYFEYKPALDLQGGYTVVFDVTPPDYSEDKLKPFREVEEILARRMAVIGLKDFELTSFYNLEDDVFQLHLTTPEKVDSQIIQILASPGNLEVLIDDPQAQADTTEESTIFDGRMSADIHNEDIKSVSVVSDSRIYSMDATQPYNYGLLLVVKPESASKLQSALLNNASTGTPLIFTLDREMVAIQSGGYLLNNLGTNDRLMLYTLFDDTRLSNAVVASVMSSPNLEARVAPRDPVAVTPTLGEEALTNLKISTLSAFLVLHVILIITLKRRSLYVLSSVYIYLAVFIALQKILNMNMSFALVCATMIMTLVFTLSQIMLISKAKTLNLSKKETEEFVDENTLSGWKAILSIAAVAPFVIFFENLLTASVNQLIQVLLLGIIVWLIYRIGFFKAIFNLLSKFSLK